MSGCYTCYSHPTLGAWGYRAPRGEQLGDMVAIASDGSWSVQTFRQPTRLAAELRKRISRGFKPMPEAKHLQTFVEGASSKARFVSTHPDLLVDKIEMGGCEGLFYVALRPGMDANEPIAHLRATLQGVDRPGYSARRRLWLDHVAKCSMFVPAVASGPADILALAQWALQEQLPLTPYADQPGSPEALPSVARQQWRKYLTSVWSGTQDIDEAFSLLGWPLAELITAQSVSSTFENEAGGW